MYLRCPHCRAARSAPLGSYLQPWDTVNCSACDKSSAAGDWVDTRGQPLGDPFDLQQSPESIGSPIPTVFVSSPTRAKSHPILARLLDDLMFDAKVNLWNDSTAISKGEDINHVTSYGIRISDFFLCIISQDSEVSKPAQLELQQALNLQTEDKQLRVIAILIDRLESNPFSRELNSIDFTVDYKTAYTQLISALGLGFRSRIVTIADEQLSTTANIIKVCGFLSEQIMSHVIRDPKIMYQISSRNFEELVAELFANFGYEVELTKRTRDGGRDVIAIRQREVNTRYLIECKRWAREHKVGVKPVRELLGVRADENASKAILATTAYFSADAKLLFERHPWELEGRDFDGLVDWLRLLKDGNRI